MHFEAMKKKHGDLYKRVLSAEKKASADLQKAMAFAKKHPDTFKKFGVEDIERRFSTLTKEEDRAIKRWRKILYAPKCQDVRFRSMSTLQDRDLVGATKVKKQMRAMM